MIERDVRWCFVWSTLSHRQIVTWRIYICGIADRIFLLALLFGVSWENEMVRVSNSQLCVVSVIRFLPTIVVHTLSLQVSSPANISLFSPVRSPIALVNRLTISKHLAPLRSELQDVKKHATSCEAREVSSITSADLDTTLQHICEPKALVLLVDHEHLRIFEHRPELVGAEIEHVLHHDSERIHVRLVCEIRYVSAQAFRRHVRFATPSRVCF